LLSHRMADGHGYSLVVNFHWGSRSKVKGMNQ
jgi:hypothetical protein